MNLKKYNKKLIEQFSHKNIKTKVETLIKKIIEHETIKIWTISEDKKEYERHKTMLDNSLKSVLDDKKISKALRENSASKLKDKKRLYLIGDHCDIRKSHSALC